MAVEHTIVPDLIKTVTEFVAKAKTKKLGAKSGIGGSHPLVVFTEALMAQFGRCLQLRLVGFSEYTLGEIRKARRKIGKTNKAALAMLLIFEGACSKFPQIWYTDDDTDIYWFFDEFMCELLGGLKDWAESESLKDLVEQVTNALNVYQTFIES